MFFRSPLASLGLLKTVTHVLAILLPMSWPCFVTDVLATDPTGARKEACLTGLSGYRNATHDVGDAPSASRRRWATTAATPNATPLPPSSVFLCWIWERESRTMADRPIGSISVFRTGSRS